MGGSEVKPRASEGPRLAWKLSFRLPCSAYATCLLRELLQRPIDAAEQKRESKAALAVHWRGREGQT